MTEDKNLDTLLDHYEDAIREAAYWEFKTQWERAHDLLANEQEHIEKYLEAMKEADETRTMIHDLYNKELKKLYRHKK